MKSILVYLVLLIFVSLSLSLNGQETQLNYRLQSGETYYLTVDLQQNTRSESQESEEIAFYSLSKMEFAVDSLDNRQQIHLSVRYRDLLISMLAPRLDIDISSASGRDPVLSEMVEMLEGYTFHAVMTRSGEVVGIHGMEEIFDTLASLTVPDTTELQVVLKTLEEAYGPDSFNSLCNLFLWIYPVISPLNNWTTDITYYFNTKPVKMVNRYVLSRSTGKMVVIQGIGMLNSMNEYYETTDIGNVKSTVSGSQTYDFQMDRETGWPLRCNSRQRVIIETTIVESKYFPTGLKIPSYTETLFEVTGGKVAQSIDNEKYKE
jgi:hypothetical protein